MAGCNAKRPPEGGLLLGADAGLPPSSSSSLKFSSTSATYFSPSAANFQSFSAIDDRPVEHARRIGRLKIVTSVTLPFSSMFRRATTVPF